MLCPSSISRFISPAIMIQSQPLRLPCSALSILLLVEKQNSDNRMTLKLVEYLYFSARECGFAQPRRKIAGLLSPDATLCN
jgi:hypothetical protein